jgi:hypothetical protein
MNALEILNEIADRLGWPQIETLDKPPLTKETRKLLRLLNRVLQTITGINDWPLLRADGTIVTLAKETSDLTDGSEEYVTATLNSDVITVDNATFDQTYIGRAFQIAGDNVVYRIIAVPAPTQLQLNRAWVSDSIVSGDERIYTIAMDRYALPVNFDRPLTDIQGFFAPYSILPISPDEFSEIRRRERGITTGEPRRYTIYGMNDNETAFLIHFHPYPEDQRILAYPYQRLHREINSDNDKILFPNRYVAPIMEMVLQLAQRDYEDDAKVERTLVDMINTYNQQVANPDVTGSRSIIRKTGRIRRGIQRSFGFGGHRLNWGSHFDKVDNFNLDH